MFKNIHEYCDLIEKLDNCLNWYTHKEIAYNRYKIHLSNGETIEVDYDFKSLPHLLGININYLRSTGFYNGKPIEILEEILENPNFLYNQFQNGKMGKNNVFSDYIDKKLNNFQNICDINIFNIEFIVKYQSDNSYISGNQKLDGDYYIAYKKDDVISIMGLRKNDDGLYRPITNLEFNPDSDEYEKFLNQLLTNQSLTSVQTLLRNFISEDGTIERKKFFYNSKDKISRLKTLNRYADKYNASVNTNYDSIFYITKVENLLKEKNKFFDILKEITTLMDKKAFIDATKLENKYDFLEEDLLSLISTFNNNLNGNSTGDNTSSNSYKDLILELREAKDKIEKQDALIEKLNKNNKTLTENNKILEEENKNYQEKEQKIRTILG